MADRVELHQDNPDVVDLRVEVKERDDGSHLKRISPAGLVVYESAAALANDTPLSEDEAIGMRGESLETAVVVKAPWRKVWYKLVGEGESDAPVNTVRLFSGADNAPGLRNAVFEQCQVSLPGRTVLDLNIYKNIEEYGTEPKGAPLNGASTISALGRTDQEAIVVEVAQARRFPTTTLPTKEMLLSAGDFAAECCSLQTWEADTVHEIPQIARFLSSLGGCTSKVYWREEEKQVAALLLRDWFEENEANIMNLPTDMASIVMGSPGIGKSTLLCLMAFYLVLGRNKNVLVYRKLSGRNCLLYMGREGGDVRYFSDEDCSHKTAVTVYQTLKQKLGTSSVWLLLDGFRYGRYSPDITDGKGKFKMLATSQQVSLKSRDIPEVHLYLLSCWSKDEIFKLGNQVCDYSKGEITERFYYSGGNVREFVLPTVNQIEVSVELALREVTDPESLLSDISGVQLGADQSDRLRRTFAKKTQDEDRLRNPKHWEQVVDSEYAALALSRKVNSSKFIE